MHYVVCSVGSIGDHFPFFKLAIDLKNNGHRVTCFTHPGFEGIVRNNGLEFVAQIPQPLTKLNKNFDSEENCLKLMETLVEPNIMPLYDWLEEHFIPGDTTIISSRMLVGARLACEKLGAPLHTFILTPYQFDHFLTQSPEVVNRVLAPVINGYRERLDLQPVEDLFSWLYSPDSVMAGFPAWFQEHQPHYPPQTTLIDFPYSEADPDNLKRLNGWLEAGEKPFLFSMNAHLEGSEKWFEVIEKVCAELGMRAILLTRQMQNPMTVTENLCKAPLLIVDALLPNLSGLAYLGGIGTFAEALRAGLPQLVMPLAKNQHNQISYIRDNGLGLILEAHNWDEPQLRAALKTLMEDSQIKKNCEKEALRYEGRESTIPDYVSFLEAFAAKHAPALSR